MITNFPKNLKILMQLREETQESLGKKIGVSQQSICSFCKGNILPKLDTFIKICLALDVEPNEIIGWNVEDLKSLGGQNLIDGLIKMKR